MEKLICKFRSDLDLRLRPWLKIKLALFASFTRLREQPRRPNQNSGGKPRGARENPIPPDNQTVVQQPTDLGG